MAHKLKFGNGVWANQKGSSLAYNDENNNYKPLPFKVTRASIGTRVNKQGLVEVVGHDTLRIDYTDSDKGVALLETGATNQFPYSENYDTWDKVGATVNANSIISPDGSLNAYKINETAGGTYHNINEDFGTLGSGTTYTASVFFKSAERTSATIYENLSTGAYNLTSFDLINGVVINEHNSHTSNIINIGNGWYRCAITFTLNANRSGSVFYGTKDSLNFVGVLNNGVYIWGSQMETNQYLTSYIPTSGSVESRQGDQVNGSGNSAVFNDSEGVLYVNIKGLSNPPSSETAISISEGTSGANRMLIRQKTNGTIGMVLRVANSTQATIDSSTINTLLYAKVGVKYKLNDIALWINGFEIGVDTSANVFGANTINQIQFNQGNNSNNFYGKTKEVGYYDTALTDSELEYLTSYRSWESMVNEINLNIIYNG